ncbi:hypothetical protein [Aeromicrobium ginsengisoli]|nr:hypothetical protein [Aeromicrobium ginsengisoli]
MLQRRIRASTRVSADEPCRIVANGPVTSGLATTDRQERSGWCNARLVE